MSRVGNSPIKLPDGANITAEGSRLVAKGSKGELEMALPDNVNVSVGEGLVKVCLLYTSPSPRDRQKSRMPSSA